MEYHRCYWIQHFGKRTVMIERNLDGSYVATTPDHPVVAEGQTREEVSGLADAWYRAKFGAIPPEQIRVKDSYRYYASQGDCHVVEIREVAPGQWIARAFEHRVIAEAATSAEAHRLVEAWGEHYLSTLAARE